MRRATSFIRASDFISVTVIAATPDLKGVLDTLVSGVFSPGDAERYRPITASLYHGDWFMVAADFDSYAATQRDVDHVWRDSPDWYARAIRNVARMGWFSSDRTILEYAREIWTAVPGPA